MIARVPNDFAPQAMLLADQEKPAAGLPSSGSPPRPGSSRVLAIIPARGGSKGLPRKNAKLLCGKPLVAYSIEAAMGSSLIDKVVVSTDDEEIFDIARQYDREIPMQRPAGLSHDTARLDQVTSHVVARMSEQGYQPDFIVMLCPTSPFRNPRMLDFLTAKGLAGHSPVTTVKQVKESSRRFIARRQGQGSTFLAPAHGTVTHVRPYGLYSGYSHRHSLSPYLHPVEDDIQLVDIDYIEHFQLAEQIINNRLFDFDLR